jgi:hypothetical protein
MERKHQRYLYIKSCLQNNIRRGHKSVSRNVRFAFHNALGHQRTYVRFIA